MTAPTDSDSRGPRGPRRPRRPRDSPGSSGSPASTGSPVVSGSPGPLPTPSRRRRPRARRAGGTGSDASSRLIRSSTVMAAGTLVSRLLGFVRNIALAGAIGTALLASTFNVANTVPNVIYILVAGGVLNSVFVPQLVRAMKESEDGGVEYAHRLLTVSFLVLLGLTVVATACAPLIISLYTSEWQRPETAVATTFAYWCLPQILFYGIFTILGQLLNARGSFGPMMWAPILNNVVVIAVCGLFIRTAGIGDPHGGGAVARISAGDIALLGGGSTLGVVLQALVLIPVVSRTGYSFRPRFDFRGWGLRHAGSLAKWTLGFVAVNQIGYLVVTKVATSVDKATQNLGYGVGFTAYQNAYLLFQLPHAIITVSLVTALLPRMSASWAEGRRDDVRADLSEGLRLAGVAIVPAAAAFVALGPDLSAVLYDVSVGEESARAIGRILAAFAVGLVAFSGQHMTHRAFYAQEDTRTPFLMAALVTALNIVGVLVAAAALPPRLVTIGLAASYSVAQAIGWGASLLLLRRRLDGVDGVRVLRTYVRALVAAGVAGAAAGLLARLTHALLPPGLGASLVATVAGGLVLLLGYLALARRMRLTEVAAVLRTVRSRAA